MKNFLTFMKTITYPGYRIHEFVLSDPKSDIAQSVILVLAGLFGVSSIFMAMWPIRSVLYFCGTVVLAVIVSGVMIALGNLIFFAITMFIGLIFTPAACIYCGCANYLYHHKGDKAGSKLKSETKADVGIRYFIDMEEGKIPFRAEMIK